MKRALTIDEAGESLGLSGKTIRKWANERRIASVKLGKALRIPAEEIDRLLRDGRREAISL